MSIHRILIIFQSISGNLISTLSKNITFDILSCPSGELTIRSHHYGITTKAIKTIKMFEVINAGNSGIARRVNKSRVVDPRDTRKFSFILCWIITSFILLRVEGKGIVNVCLRRINFLWKNILGWIRERESNGEALWTKGLRWERFWGERIKEAEGIQSGWVRGFFVLFSGAPALLTEGCKD